MSRDMHRRLDQMPRRPRRPHSRCTLCGKRIPLGRVWCFACWRTLPVEPDDEDDDGRRHRRLTPEAVDGLLARLTPSEPSNADVHEP